MNFENGMVRILNWRPQVRENVCGYQLGYARPLNGGASQLYQWPWLPIQHTCCFGRSGTGKTTALLRIVTQHLHNDRSFIFFDFHGHACEQLLADTATHSNAPAVLVDPWSDPVVGWNPLQADRNEAYGVVQELLNIFHRRLWPDAWGVRIEETLRNVLLALVHAKLTLTEIQPFLTDAFFRRTVLQKVSDVAVREFWVLRFERRSPSLKANAVETVMNKMAIFAQDPMLRYVLGQRNSTLDLDALLIEGKSLIVNLSLGAIRSHHFLLAALLLAKLKGAVYRRKPNSIPFALFLDEFQEILGLDSLDDSLASFRKFNVSMFLATQTLDLPPSVRSAIFGNCRRFLAFAMSIHDAGFVTQEFGVPDARHFATLMSDLPTGNALVKVRGDHPYVLQVTARTWDAPRESVERGRSMCLQDGRPRADVAQEIDHRQPNARRATPVSKRAADSANDRTDEDLPEGYDQ